MTVKDMINKLLDMPMNADILFVTDYKTDNAEVSYNHSLNIVYMELNDNTKIKQLKPYIIVDGGDGGILDSIYRFINSEPFPYVGLIFLVAISLVISIIGVIFFKNFL